MIFTQNFPDLLIFLILYERFEAVFLSPFVNVLTVFLRNPVCSKVAFTGTPTVYF